LSLSYGIIHKHHGRMRYRANSARARRSACGYRSHNRRMHRPEYGKD
jgi:hypothetical protein